MNLLSSDWSALVSKVRYVFCMSFQILGPGGKFKDMISETYISKIIIGH